MSLFRCVSFAFMVGVGLFFSSFCLFVLLWFVLLLFRCIFSRIDREGVDLDGGRKAN